MQVPFPWLCLSSAEQKWDLFLSWYSSLTAYSFTIPGPAYTESRRVRVQQNPFFAGRYSLDQAIFGLQVTRRLGMMEQSESPL